MTFDQICSLSCYEDFVCDPNEEPVPADDDLEKEERWMSWIIHMMMDCSEAETPAEVADMLGVSESWLLDDFSRAYELLSMFCYLTGTEFTINRRKSENTENEN